MKIRNTIVRLILSISLFATSHLVYASIVSGNILNLRDDVTVQTFGDGTNHVSLSWSINTTGKGFFYGSSVFTADTDVAFAKDITDISQITDASIFSFTDGVTGPHCDANCDPDGVGDFLVWKNINTGHYGAFRIDEINYTVTDPPGDAELSGTWWFQTDGTANLVPLPAAVWLFGTGLIGFIGMRKNH